MGHQIFPQAIKTRNDFYIEFLLQLKSFNKICSLKCVKLLWSINSRHLLNPLPNIILKDFEAHIMCTSIWAGFHIHHHTLRSKPWLQRYSDGWCVVLWPWLLFSVTAQDGINHFQTECIYPWNVVLHATCFHF